MKVRMYKIVEEYNRLRPQGHWFDESTMRFFKSRLPSYGYIKGDDTYFISSEDDGSRGRRYSIRKMDSTGDIDTVGEFYQYTKREANRELAHNILGWKIKDL